MYINCSPMNIDLDDSPLLIFIFMFFSLFIADISLFIMLLWVFIRLSGCSSDISFYVHCCSLSLLCCSCELWLARRRKATTWCAKEGNTRVASRDQHRESRRLRGRESRYVARGATCAFLSFEADCSSRVATSIARPSRGGRETRRLSRVASWAIFFATREGDFFTQFYFTT